MHNINLGELIAKMFFLLMASFCLLYQILSPNFNFQKTVELNEPSFSIWILTCISINFLTTFPLKNQLRSQYISGVVGAFLTIIALTNSLVVNANSLTGSYLVLLFSILVLILINKKSLKKHGRFTKLFLWVNLEEMTVLDFVYSFLSGLSLIIVLLVGRLNY